MNVIEVRPSRCLVLLLAGGHALAAFSCLYLPGFGLKGGGLLVVGLALVHALGRQRRLLRQFGLASDGSLHLEPSVQHSVPASVSPSTVVSTGAIWLAWRAGVGRPSGAVLLCRDQMSASEWRTLQVWLRLRVASRMVADVGA